MKKYTLLLLAAAALASCHKNRIVVSLSNPLDIPRTNEVVEVPWAELRAAQQEALTPQTVVVRDDYGNEIPSQVVYGGGAEPVSLIFQASLEANEVAQYTIRQGVRGDYPAKVYGRLVPERKDDFAWENDRIAFRMYGPALEATGEVSNGIDVWVKSTDSLVIDGWYSQNDYHRDHGQGFDGYKVGRTLGAGAMAPYSDQKLWLGNNFESYKVLDNGPLRVSFELEYAPFAIRDLTEQDKNSEKYPEVANTNVTEKRIITLDAGTHFNKIEEIYGGAPETMPVAAGIVLRGDQGTKMSGDDVACYWEPQNNDNGVDNGHIAVAVIVPRAYAFEEAYGHLLALGEYTSDRPFVYYLGAGWSKGGVPSADAWLEMAQRERLKRNNPITVKISAR